MFGSHHVFGADFTRIWVLSFSSARLSTLRQTVRARGLYGLLRICFGHVFWILEVVGNLIFPWLNSLTITASMPVLACLPIRCCNGRRCRTPICWGEVSQRELGSTEIRTTESIQQICERLKAAQSRQKSYADKRGSYLEFSVGDKVLLKVSPWKGVIPFRKRGKLGPRFIGPFEIVACVGKVAYRLELPSELSQIHDTFHVSQLRKCLADESAFVPLEDIEVDERLNYAEKPIAVLERKTKTLRNKEIGIVKVQWEHGKGSEWTWEPEDEMRRNHTEFNCHVLGVEGLKCHLWKFKGRERERREGDKRKAAKDEIEAWVDWGVLALTSIAFKIGLWDHCLISVERHRFLPEVELLVYYLRLMYGVPNVFVLYGKCGSTWNNDIESIWDIRSSYKEWNLGINSCYK
ncbi:LOW QUALITY PROTEIN: hypothetical protein OSB04_un000912 [Centaurea solstitialis]|uniref:Tf2-1-like SH3-like domain-containing protein n=1 Tax=Centaurea solstitialis TaxID=347529 RepID=A0AA38W346_9ASTR|nr:LOW QUALITY PROTEIN: hypothetical protein OSB04_un000912 [Centaurea solstitialis]